MTPDVGLGTGNCRRCVYTNIYIKGSVFTNWSLHSVNNTSVSFWQSLATSYTTPIQHSPREHYCTERYLYKHPLLLVRPPSLPSSPTSTTQSPSRTFHRVSKPANANTIPILRKHDPNPKPAHLHLNHQNQSHNLLNNQHPLRPHPHARNPAKQTMQSLDRLQERRKAAPSKRQHCLPRLLRTRHLAGAKDLKIARVLVRGMLVLGGVFDWGLRGLGVE